MEFAHAKVRPGPDVASAKGKVILYVPDDLFISLPRLDDNRLNPVDERVDEMSCRGWRCNF